MVCYGYGRGRGHGFDLGELTGKPYGEPTYVHKFILPMLTALKISSMPY